MPEDSVVVLATHMPKIEVLAGHLTGSDRFPAFKTSAACLIEMIDGRGTFRWMLDPETLALT